MLFRVIFNTSNMDYWRKLEGGETKLELCKKLLQEQQTFAYVLDKFYSLNGRLQAIVNYYYCKL